MGGNSMIGADAIVRCLEAEGVEVVFGYPGVAICPFYNSILQSEIKTVRNRMPLMRQAVWRG